jgi:hypothetical protein
MPEMQDVASHFDDITVTDSYTGAFAFKGQFSSFDESSPDGSVARKRTLSLRPGTAIPARRAIQFMSENWIVGDGNTDGFQDSSIRKAYWMKKSSGLVNLVTPLEQLTGVSTLSMHAAVEYLKDTVNGVTDAEYDPFWNVYVSQSETVAVGKFVKHGSFLYRIRGFHYETSGFNLAQCDQIDQENLVTATVQSASSYDPITDTITATSSAVPAILLEPSKFYRYRNLSDSKFNSGDLTALVASAPAIGTNIAIGSTAWRVLEVQAELDAWALHIRRV